MDRARRWGLLAAKVALAAAVLAYIASLIQRDAVRLEDLRSVLGRWPWLVAAAGAFCVSFTVAAFRWWLLLRAMDLSPTGGEVASLTLVGAFFNSFMPGAVGGDLVKAYYVARDRHGKRTEAVTTVLVDRFLGLFSLVLVAMTAMLANAVEIAGNAALQPLAWAVVGVIAAVSFLGLVFFGMHRLPWLVRLAGRLPYRDRLHDLYTALYAYRYRKGTALAAILLSVANHFMGIVMVWCVVRAQGESLPLVRFAFVVPLGLLVNAVPLFPGGLGVGELAFAKLFVYAFSQELADPFAAGFNTGLLFHAVYLGVNMVGVIPYLRGRRQFQGLVASEAETGISLPSPPAGG